MTLVVRELDVSMARAQVLRGVELCVPTGETVALVGRNGAGKTTLMRSIMGLVPVARGRIVFEGVDLCRLASHQRARRGIGYMPEDRRLVPGLAVEENILLPGWATENDAIGTRLSLIYARMPEVARLASRKAVQLSGGEQKIAALARALMCGTRLLLLDEPFEGVAPALARRLGEVLMGLKDTGLSILFAASDDTHSVDLFDRLFVIERGVVREAAHESQGSFGTCGGD